MFKKLLSIALIINTIIAFTSCKKDTQINPPIVKSVDVTAPTPFVIKDSIYPNPCNGTFNIKTNTTDSQTVVMSDMMGREELNLVINGTTAIFDNSLSNGMHYIKITNKAGIIIRKLIVSR